MIVETEVGAKILTAGSKPPIRVDRSGAMVISDARTRFQEAVLQGNCFALCQAAATNNTVVAGNAYGAGAAASTNFCLWNPIGSGKIAVLWQFNLCVVTCTTLTSYPVFHALFNATSVTATSSGGIRNLNGASGGSQMFCLNSTAGTAITGGLAPYPVCMANFTQTVAPGTAATWPNPTTDLIEGRIIIPQGIGWVPLIYGTASSALVVSYSVVWEEIPA